MNLRLEVVLPLAGRLQFLLDGFAVFGVGFRVLQFLRHGGDVAVPYALLESVRQPAFDHR